MHPRQELCVGCWVVTEGCVGTVGLVAAVGIVTTFVGDWSTSSNFTRSRLSSVFPMASLSNTSASLRVSCRTVAISGVGGGGGTVGHVTTAVGDVGGAEVVDVDVVVEAVVG